MVYGRQPELVSEPDDNERYCESVVGFHSIPNDICSIPGRRHSCPRDHNSFIDG